MSYYFSRVLLSARPRDNPWLVKLSAAGEMYRDHALVWRLFAQHTQRTFVFRREQDEYGRLCYYVVSPQPPQLDPQWFSGQIKPYEPQLQVGEWLQFSLRANPTISRRAEGSKHSQQHDVLMDAKHHWRAQPEQIPAAMERAASDWLQQRASAWGIRLDHAALVSTGYQQHRFAHKGGRMEFSTLDYQGRLQVEDSAKLRAVLYGGVGRRRGFGCGLLLVRRVGAR